MKQRVFYRELAYMAGVITMACGAALMEHADFGLSMVIAPAYLLHVKLAEFFPFFSFGLAEDVFQALLLCLMCLVLRRFRLSYLFSFVTAVLYGIFLDGAVALFASIPQTLPLRLAMYVAGMALTSAGVAFFCRTYIAPEVYELFVEKLSHKLEIPFHRVKTVYDIASLLLSVILSFAFFGWGHFEGIHWGTLVCALVNGALIGQLQKLYDRLWRFEDRFPKLRKVMP